MTQLACDAMLFDLDGVLVHTDKLHYRSWKEMTEDEGIEFNEKINHRLRGVSRSDSLEIILERAPRAYSDEEKQAMMDRKNARFQELIETLTPDDLLPGSLGLIESMRSAGWKVGLCSSSRNAAAICERLGVANLFDGFVDGHGINKTKPDPEIFIRGARALDLFPGDCIVFEDAQSGIDAAKTAGAAVVGITGAGHELRGADLTVGGLDEISVEDLDAV